MIETKMETLIETGWDGNRDGVGDREEIKRKGEERCEREILCGTVRLQDFEAEDSETAR